MKLLAVLCRGLSAYLDFVSNLLDDSADRFDLWALGSDFTEWESELAVSCRCYYCLEEG